jgi:hypothetical protein
MHDIDRTQLEMEWEADGFELEDEYDGYGEMEAESGVFDEADEMELAADLLEITDEAELDQFLGNLIKKAGRAVGKVVRSPVGQALGGMLKGVAKKALPIAGSALGNLVVPGAGGAIGGQLASAAGRIFGLELEGMSPEDQEFEVARRFVRFAGQATQNATQAPPNTPPAAIAQKAIAAAAQQHAPGLLRRGGANGKVGSSKNRSQSGRWVRSGRKIILYGA